MQTLKWTPYNEANSKKRRESPLQSRENNHNHHRHHLPSCPSQKRVSIQSLIRQLRNFNAITNKPKQNSATSTKTNKKLVAEKEELLLEEEAVAFRLLLRRIRELEADEVRVEEKSKGEIAAFRGEAKKEGEGIGVGRNQGEGEGGAKK